MKTIFAVMFLSTIALLSPIKDSLGSLRYTQTDPAVAPVLSSDPDDSLLFDQVNFHTNKNLAQALQDLRVMASRACLVVPLGDDYENKSEGSVLLSRRYTSFMLMIADRDLSIDSGSMQSTLHSPGILATKDLVVEFLCGRPLNLNGRIVPIEPDAGAVVALQWEDERKAPTVGRECWNQAFRAFAGEKRVSFGRQS